MVEEACATALSGKTGKISPTNLSLILLSCCTEIIRHIFANSITRTTRSIAEMAWDQPKTTVVVRYTDNNQIPRRDDSGYYICDAEECTTHYKTPPIFLEHVKDVRAGRIYLCDKCHGKFNRTSILTPEVLAKRRCRKGECDGKPMVSRTTRGPRQKLKDRADCFQGYIRQ
jgi:hypothetical protein